MRRRECLSLLLGSTAHLLAARALPTVRSGTAGTVLSGTDSAASDIYTDVTAEAGINWKQFSGESNQRLLLETMGGGVGFADFEGDGLLDIFLVNGGETPQGKTNTPVRHALYRNLGHGRFEDVASKAGVDRLPFYGMGVAVADYDNDGFQDLFITGHPRCALFHNNGDGTFTEVTERAGVLNSGKWAASAAWFDYDRDGRLDLLVTNYVKLSLTNPPRCEYSGKPTYCAQTSYEGDQCRLYHNGGDGRFTDVTASSGIGRYIGRALGVVAVDVDDDGWIDLFVARDASPNLLLINRRNGTFEDVAVQAEVAYSPDGDARAGMGTDAGDVNGDGRPDLVVTTFNDEHHALYINTGSFPFQEATVTSGLAGATRRYVGWGTHFVDFDNDGNLDLVIVNGHINQTIELTRKDVSYREPPLLMANDGHGSFRDMREPAGPVFRTGILGRGLAVGDYDNDGGVDLLIGRLNNHPLMLHNNIGRKNAWLGVQLVGTRSNRDAIGAKLILRVGNTQRVRWVTGGSSYLSSHDRRVIFGLGRPKASLQPLELEIRWPNGMVQTVSGLEPGRYHRVVEPGNRT